MSLENLLAINRLFRHDATPESIRKPIAAAERNLTDARATNISVENRFDAAYKTIMQCAMAALWAKGYRTSTSEPGITNWSSRSSRRRWTSPTTS